ncbi:MAG: uroporphyrinogen-III synthase, partial [Firmicutes bacterium]|nr:uroporphyrinogen-III synthase [Bacillota bacterium]
MRLLVTRPEPDAEALAERLRALGHEVLVAPMLPVVPRAEQA